jgi:voltage-gated potassium channel Kch
MKDADIEVIKTLLALCNSPNRRTEPYHIVAEIQEPRNIGIARMVGGAEVELILAGDLISRITVQTCRQNGLSVIHTELLDFDGAEIYFADAASVVGKTFGEALFSYRTSSLLGLFRANKSQVLPALDSVFQAGDQLIVIAEDAKSIVVAPQVTPDIQTASITHAPEVPAKSERTLVLGWNWRAPAIVSGLDAYVAPGSEVVVVAEVDHQAQFLAEIGTLTNIQTSFRRDDTTDRRLLDSLDVPSFDQIIVLCSDEIEAQRADARVLVSLLHLREIGEMAAKNLSIVSEMRDINNRALAEITQADDFIVSDKLVSLMLAQVSENKQLMPVLEDLFDPDGAEIYLKPATWYVHEGVDVSYDTVLEAARARGEIAIGYRIDAKARDAAAAYGVVVNPDKAVRLSFGADDRVIVLAES